MNLLLRASIVLLTVAYPFVVYFGLTHLNTSYLALLVLVIALLRSLSSMTQMGPTWLWVSMLVLIALWILVFDQAEALKIYPVLVSLSFLVLFVWSLIFPPTIIERLARLTDPDLAPQGVVYTRKVTIVWCVFFVVNGSAALITGLWASNEIWVLYNGLIAYVLMGILFAVEYLIRRFVRSDRG